MEKRSLFAERLLYERMLRGWSQAELAAKIGCDTKTIGRWERSETLPTPQLRPKLFEVLGKNAEELGLIEESAAGRSEQPSDTLPPGVTSITSASFTPSIPSLPIDQQSSPDQQVPSSLHQLSEVLTTVSPQEQIARERDTSEHEQSTIFREDRGEIPPVGNLYGREEEHAQLEYWIAHDRCRLIAVLGMGGVGKTALAAKLVDQIKDKFEYVFWQSLQNAPPVEYILKNCILVVSDQQQVDLPEDINSQISLLIKYLRGHRCLIVLDNVESILQAGSRAGHYRGGYESYGTLFTHIGEANHHSCLLLTSREKPREIASLEGEESLVRSLRLSGVAEGAGREILKGKGLVGSDEDWAKLIRLYAGNPLALKLVSEPMREVFGGNITRFLEGGEAVFGDIHDLLDQQFRRLSEREQEILSWLAIEREPVSLDDLWEESVLSESKGALLEALDSLRRRFLIESSGTSRFSLQPVILEYVTDRFVERVYKEIESEALDLFASHALIKAQSKDYVRESQVRVILAPLLQKLLKTSGKVGTEKKLRNILAMLHTTYFQKPTYAAGNVLNMLIELNTDLRATDFSHLVVWQAYLRRATLPDVNFAHANLAKSVFLDTFGSILSVAFSPNGELLAAGTGSGEIRIWQVANGTPFQTCQGHTDWVWAVAFSPNGSMLASGSSDQTIRLWESNTGQCLNVLYGHTHRIRSVAFSPDGKILASASEDRTIRLWDVSNGEILNVLQGHTNPARSVALSSDGQRLVSGSDDTTVRIWDVSTGECLMILQGHTSQIWSIALSSKGVIASGSDDKTVRLWDMSTGECLKILQGHSNWICSLAFSPDGNIVASASADHTVRLWNVDTGQRLNTLQGHDNWVNSVAFSPGGQILASGSHDQTVRLWEVSSGYCLNTLQGYSMYVRSLAFSPDGKMLASGDRLARLWDVRSGQSLSILQGHGSWVRSLAFSPDGQLLVSGSDDHTARLWRVRTGQSLVLQGHTNRVKSVTFSPDGRTVATGSDDQTVRLWDSQTGRLLKTLQGHTNRIRAVAFNPKGQVLASGSDDQTVRLWDSRTGRLLKTLQGHTNRVWSIAFSPGGSMLATGSEDWTVRLWEVSSGQYLNILQGHTNPVWSISFSPDGSVLASSSEDQTVRLWEVSSGQNLHLLQGHTNPIWAIAFSPDSQILASGSHDYTVRLWKVGTGECLHVLEGHADAIWATAFSPDGIIVASCSDDGTTRLWDVQTGECFRVLKSDRPYERMNIAGVIGLTEVQKAALRALGAIEGET